MTALIEEIRRIRASSLARNSGWMFLGQGLGIVCQGVYFICLGRLLGSAEYGVYVGAVALVGILSQYSSLGSHSVFLRYVSPDPRNFSRYWANVLVTTAVLGGIFVAVLTWAGPNVSRSYSHGMLLCIGLGDCICGQFAISSSRVFQALERMKVTALLNLLTSALRALLAGALLCSLHRATARQWVVATLIVSVFAAGIAVTLVTKNFGKPDFSPTLLKKRAVEGVVFALCYSTTGLYNDFDKVMLGHFGMNAANGIYAMAYRIVDVCTMPIYSVQVASFPQFFKKGSVAGVSGTSVYAIRIIKRTALAGILMAGCMYLAAPVIPHIVGSSFSQSVSALRWLCLLPVFRSLHVAAGDAIAGGGHVPLRLLTQTIAAIFNVGANFFLIPSYGWLGAAWSSLATDGLLAIMNWSALLLKRS